MNRISCNSFFQSLILQDYINFRYETMSKLQVQWFNFYSISLDFVEVLILDIPCAFTLIQ